MPCSPTCTSIVQETPSVTATGGVRVDALNPALEGSLKTASASTSASSSWHVPHVSDAPLEDIVDLMLKVRAGAYSIGANVRHEHEYHCGKRISCRPERSSPRYRHPSHPAVEHPKLVAERIVRFAKIVGRENVIASTDCGFAQAEGVQRVHPQVMWAKYSALAEGAGSPARNCRG